MRSEGHTLLRVGNVVAFPLCPIPFNYHIQEDRMAATSELVYLKKVLGFTLPEWQALPDEYKEWYRQAAREEMALVESEKK